MGLCFALTAWGFIRRPSLIDLLSASMLLIGILAILTAPAYAALCGYNAQGHFECDHPIGCAVGPSGNEVCALPAGCGYVNGNYVCSGDEVGDPKTPAAQQAKENSGEVAGLEWLSGFFAGEGADTWIESALRNGIEWAVVAWLDMKFWGIKFAWGIAKSILEDLGIISALAAAFATLPPQVTEALTFFNVFAALANILTAGMTRFVMRMVPGL